jgi:hypothetical protein
MTALIARIRILINDAAGASQIFSDDEIEDVLDESRVDVVNEALTPTITYSTTSMDYLNYYSKRGGGWETDYTIKQNLTTTVTPSSDELIAGKFVFSSSTDPALFITGKIYDVYRAAADLLERWSAKYALSYDINVNGQTLHRSQAIKALMELAKRYRAQQRPSTTTLCRSDLATGARNMLGPRGIDYISSGD